MDSQYEDRVDCRSDAATVTDRIRRSSGSHAAVPGQL